MNIILLSSNFVWCYVNILKPCGCWWVQPVLTCQNSLLCLQNIFMFSMVLRTYNCFLITDLIVGFCNRDAVRLLRGKTILLNPLGRAMAQTFSLPPFTAEVRVPSQASRCEFCG